MKTINEEIEEMFDELVVGYDEVNLSVAGMLLKNLHERRDTSSGKFVCRHQVFTIENGALIQCGKGYSFYGNSGKLSLAVELFKMGWSIRRVCAVTELSKTTANKIQRRMPKILCVCGKPVTHRGWCSYRYAQSELRQEFMRKWHKKQIKRVA